MLTSPAQPANYDATQLATKINGVQKQIGAKKKVGSSDTKISQDLVTDKFVAQAKENADDLLQEKIALEKEKKALLESVAAKEAALKAKTKTIGNFVHDSVPVSNNEVCLWRRLATSLPGPG